ncbi:sigma-E processing peptidase SpoIIGA [Thermosediminibacter litoriperuensis]|uniref:Sporulation sigma-E factor-processing peptidase n=1 Tax=Thermosediminibacter litoriperuensis TaxID=291989 RepID=A0A5S5ATB0_9FIRM|nr:sigma-E processing peptidase SpoIIGA [Thermosediminibacter litoriperuensis]TYP54934.1 stage II sporulation protein GA (sporulation sigma-E factor processing peptidase) [Thermosediminibacter litoriperuensis]
MVIYFDVVFIINFLMNFTILWLVKLILKLNAGNLRFVAGALLGNLFLLEVFFPTGALLQTIPGKIIVSILMVLIAFYPLSFSEFIKALGFFYFVSFMVGGGAFALFYLINAERAFTGSLLVNNISVPWWILLVSSAFLFVFFKFMWPLIYRILSRDSFIVPMTILFGERQFKIKALIDTGNDLRDPISNYPVIIVEFSVLEDFFPQEIRTLMMKEPGENLEDITRAVSNSYWAARIRIIPFSSIGKNKGLMVGFKPDRVIINFDNKVYEIKNAVLGIYHKVLSPQGTYRALLNPELLIG